jgi:hypothetical protein
MQMKKLILSCMIATVSGLMYGQPIPVEVMAGHQYAMYQHTLSKSISGNDRFGVVHLSNILGWYRQPPQKGGMQNEFMNQGYLRYGLSGSFSVQYLLNRKNWLFVVSPRFDIREKGAYEMFGMFEFRPLINGNMKLYMRIQGMTSHGPYHHNRSYQRLRLGVEKRGIQFGAGFNTDVYGKSRMVKLNAGLFVRKAIL